jgi:hypothetical protein
VSGQLHAPVALPRGKSRGFPLVGAWVGPRAGLDDMEKGKFLNLPGLETPTPSVAQPVATGLTDCATPCVQLLKHFSRAASCLINSKLRVLWSSTALTDRLWCSWLGHRIVLYIQTIWRSMPTLSSRLKRAAWGIGEVHDLGCFETFESTYGITIQKSQFKITIMQKHYNYVHCVCVVRRSITKWALV